MSVLGVFCRPNHPRGYGNCGGLDEVWAGRYYTARDQVGYHMSGTAHGYVTVVVLSADWEQHGAVVLRLAEPSADPWKRGDGWYGGPYEPVWAMEGEFSDVADHGYKHSRWGGTASRNPGRPFLLGEADTYGDNRACAFLAAEDVL